MVKILQSTSVGIMLFDPLTSLECRWGRHFFPPFTHKENEAQKYFIELPRGAEPGPATDCQCSSPLYGTAPTGCKATSLWNVALRNGNPVG